MYRIRLSVVSFEFRAVLYLSGCCVPQHFGVFLWILKKRRLGEGDEKLLKLAEAEEDKLDRPLKA